MKIGTILFTYHRNEYTRQVIEALSQNDVLPEKLYIFQDGIKEGTNVEGWKKVNELIQNIEWCETELHVSKENKGLAKSIVAGINYVMQECDAAIILEDDCVPHKQFMRFMVSALQTYQSVKKVYSISGYAWDVDLAGQEYDAYFNGRNCSYGWGTWQDRWSQYEEDYQILTKIKNNPETNARLNTWGRDLAGMVVGNVLGKCNSWAVFWGLKIIELGGFCLSPYKQLVENIGFDGSGIHCGNLRISRAKEEAKEFFSFPEQVMCTKECEEEFRFLFAGKRGEEKLQFYQTMLTQWIQLKQAGKNMRIPDEWDGDIAVWGKGKVFDCFVQELPEQIAVKYIIESRPSIAEYKGIPIVALHELPEKIKNVVVIPYFDLEIIKTKAEKMRKDLHFFGINELVQ